MGLKIEEKKSIAFGGTSTFRLPPPCPRKREVVLFATLLLFEISNDWAPPLQLAGSAPVKRTSTSEKAQDWRACNKLSNIWKSTLPRDMKLRLFTTTVEPVLIYGAESWTITSKTEKALDGCYTRLLRKALDIS